ncbi:MAG: hypothetical protein J7604_24205 [Sporocytophaga sp.]|uniref:hypothetical protein n=1 Tax=Sporocytophaga sp. TaxID=2231183 RepID=UPI001B2BFC67|nr:hypothetical protein [Sporocytophaga sp.]MBO9703339.1 hypothetical protein [Sporocytophaga sp.]
MTLLTTQNERRLRKCDNEIANACINTIKNKLNDLSIDDIKITNTRLDFKNPFFNFGQGRTHLMAPIDKGYFEINISTRTFIYSYSFARTFYFTLGLSVFIGLPAYFSMHSIFPGLFAFAWLFGVNWIITTIRHETFINRLTDSLNAQIKKSHSKPVS